MNRFVIIDLETTGHASEAGDKIIEIGLVIIEDNEIIDEYATLFNPNQMIPPFITNLTGIIDEDVKEAPVFKDKAKKISDIFHNSYLVAHNVPFDLGFLNDELTNNGYNELTNPVLDTVELARIFYPQAPGHTLTQLADYLEIKHKNPHRALSDAYVTAELLLKIIDKMNSLPYETISHLKRLAPQFSSDLYSVFYNRLQELLYSPAQQIDYVSYNGLAFKEYTEEIVKQHEQPPTFGIYLDDIYEGNGSMEKELRHFEQRAGQREMSEVIYDAFHIHNHALIEAGTGTGKSLAYLLPAIYEAVMENERVMISTHTINLQTQLIEEEIPIVRKLIPLPFKAALLKGKNQYISLEKFNQELIGDEEDNYDTSLTKAIILVWLMETKTGDIDEIHLSTGGYSFFNGISAASEEEIDPYSPWFYYSYYQLARKRAERANIVITNHALLCADILSDYKLIPKYNKAIIDEAHHLENTASRQYGLQINYMNMQYKLNLIGTYNGGSWLNKIMDQYPFIQSEGLFNEWNSLFNQTKYEIDDLFQMLFDYVMRQKRKKPLSDIGKIQYQFEDADEDRSSWQVIKDIVSRIILFMQDLIQLLANLEPYFNEGEYENKFVKDDLLAHIQTLKSFIERLEHLFISSDSVKTVNWIEMDAYGTKNDLYIYSEPLDMSSILATDFFEQKDSVILTSATLTMRDSFSFMQGRLGLDSKRLITKSIKSPFSYEDQVQLMVPNDFPQVNKDHLDDFIFSVCEAILSLAEITKGRMLVLFTSYDMLRRSHFILKEAMDMSKYFLIAQGISSGSRTRLKKEFQSFEQAILLGTSSFWEGVDIPGDDLSCLVIARLPFQPPNHPIYEAKAKLLEEEGKNAFMNYSLPNAVIRFKQGFGRLIRSTNDRGIVFICDSRIIQAQYGKFFTESIPDVPINYESTHSLIQLAEEWF